MPVTAYATELIHKHNLTTYVDVKFKEPGFHSWPDAPNESFYLRTAHRHLFHFVISISVAHTERAVEFHAFKGAVRAFLFRKFSLLKTPEGMVFDFETLSCESIAAIICGFVLEEYPQVITRLFVAVSEDDEFTGVVCYDNTDSV